MECVAYNIVHFNVSKEIFNSLEWCYLKTWNEKIHTYAIAYRKLFFLELRSRSLLWFLLLRAGNFNRKRLSESLLLYCDSNLD